MAETAPHLSLSTRRYPNAAAIGFATTPSIDEGGLSLAAVNRMIAAAVRGVRARERSTAK